MVSRTTLLEPALSAASLKLPTSMPMGKERIRVRRPSTIIEPPPSGIARIVSMKLRERFWTSESVCRPIRS